MAVAFQGVGLHAFVQFGVEIHRLHFSSGAGDAAFGVEDDRAFADKLMRDERQARQNTGRRKASGIGHQASGSDVFPIALDVCRTISRAALNLSSGSRRKDR